jgi:beta-N-acetylhexosaminidase
VAVLASACTTPLEAPDATSTTAVSIPTTTTTSTTVVSQPSGIERMARTVIMVTLRSTSLSAEEREHLARGGRSVILFGPNIAEPAQVTMLTADIACAAGRPPLIAVDHELGVEVRRLGGGMVSPLPTPDEALAMTPEDVRSAAIRLGREMLNLGINVDLAPVVDVVDGPNPVLAGRHLGADPEAVATVGAAFVAGLSDAGVVAVPKHFPGHGRTVTDPHDESAVVHATMRDLEFTDWPPFDAAFAAGAPAVMVGHPVYTAIDDAAPASLSPAVYQLLRQRFEFDGVAVTDALGMAALAGLGDPGQIAVAALAAGADLLVFEDPLIVESVVDAVMRAALDRSLPRDRLAEAAARVDALAESAARVRCVGE